MMLLTVAVFAAGVSAAVVPILPRQVGSCEGQSCYIAELAGSTKEGFEGSTVPNGTTLNGICCVTYYNPAVKQLAYDNVQGSQLWCSIFPYSPSPASMLKRDVEETSMIEKRQTTCTPKILVYARGTFEPGELGVTLGPAIQTQLNTIAPGQWTVEGVDYDPSTDGDYCLALPGGVDHGVGKLASVISSCPNSRVFVGGYSQGAMVAHNTIAYSDPSVAAKVQGVLVYGDPFNGATIKNYNGPIITYCVDGDGVCSGEFNITSQHLAYSGADVNDGCARLNAL